MTTFMVVGETRSVHQKMTAAIGTGVFFAPTLVVTCDHDLTDHHTVGSVVKLVLKEEIVTNTVVVRNPRLDFAILKASTPRSFIPPWGGDPNELSELILASYRLGINLYPASFTGVLGFKEAHGRTLNPDRTEIIYSCETFPGDSGAPLLHKDGLLVGIHQTVTNALREEIDPKRSIKDRLTTLEAILTDIMQHGLPQKPSGLLVHMLKDAAQEWSENSMA